MCASWCTLALVPRCSRLTNPVQSAAIRAERQRVVERGECCFGKQPDLGLLGPARAKRRYVQVGGAPGFGGLHGGFGGLGGGVGALG